MVLIECAGCAHRRVELLLLHQPGEEPSGTIAWLGSRPLLARHHHVRLSHPKVLLPLPGPDKLGHGLAVFTINRADLA
jgi:hypothetical protein